MMGDFEKFINNVNKDNIHRLPSEYIKHIYDNFDTYATLVATLEKNGISRKDGYSKTRRPDAAVETFKNNGVS